MKKKKRTIRLSGLLALAALTLAWCFSGGVLSAEPADGSETDWPQWQGPHRDSVSHETGLLDSWPEAGPKVLWRLEMGEGYSGIAISDGRLYTMHSPGEDELVVCLDAATGQEIWRTRTDSKYHDDEGNGPRSMPTVDGDSIFALGAQGKLYALDASNGEKRWEHDFVSEFGSTIPQWGFSTSPLVEGDLLLVEAGGEVGKSIVAFDKKSGNVMWTSHTDKPAYSSPIAVTFGGKRQIIFLTAKTLLSVSPRDGKIYWQYIPWPDRNEINIATPLLIPDDRIFISAAYDKGAVVLQMKATGDTIAVEEVWKDHAVMQNWTNSSVLLGKYLYGFDKSILKCIDANTGEEQWATRGFQRGALILVDGHLIILGENGKLALAEATPSAYKEKASAQVLAGRCFTPPTLAGGKLYVRNHEALVCLDMTGLYP
jgi:outer membrane protein assembly factor BamB